ncbi:MAG: hypothetical protein H3C34_01635 [Caldilineaceae bacterium]|nr:hypothetical protein [Caldilineaceae bacterium]
MDIVAHNSLFLVLAVLALALLVVEEIADGQDAGSLEDGRRVGPVGVSQLGEYVPLAVDTGNRIDAATYQGAEPNR